MIFLNPLAMKNQMKKTICFFLALSAACAAATDPSTNLAFSGQSKLQANGGIDLRIRQQATDHIPGHPADPEGDYPEKEAENSNYVRFRTRVRGELEYENWKLNLRLSNEFREYLVKNGKRRDDRSYHAFDEVFFDNLYLEGKELFDGLLDIRIGRQDFYRSDRPDFGSGRLFYDGTAGDGSRSLYFDAIRLSWHLREKSTLETIALWNSGRNELKLGRAEPDPHLTTELYDNDDADRDEAGAIIYWTDEAFADRLTWEMFYVYRYDPKYYRDNRRVPSLSLNTFGIRLLPSFTETLSGEFEFAAQVGKHGDGTQATGWSSFTGLIYRPDIELSKDIKPYARLDLQCMSGDKDFGAGHGDSAWNPLWGRSAQTSELLVLGPMSGRKSYWSNLIYPTLSAGADFGKKHRVKALTGPLFAMVDDGRGGGSGPYEGWLTTLRYDFPLVMRGKNGGWLDIYGHILAEVFKPGDYYAADNLAYFLRWEISFAF